METFTQTENKAMLWTLLFEGGVFGGISGDKVSIVKKKLDEVVEEVWELKQPNEDITTLNKRVCQMMLVAAERMRDTEIPNTPHDTPALITAADMSAQRQSIFSNNLERKQNEFNQYMAGNQPSEIDFSDKPEEPLEGLDSALEALQARRNLEIEKAIGSQDKEIGAAWIQGDAKQPNNIDKHIKIGEDTSLTTENVQIINQEKRVTFQDDHDSADKFLGKLKTLAPRAKDAEALAPRAKDAEALAPRAKDAEALAPRSKDAEALALRAKDAEALAPESLDLDDIRHKLEVIEKGQGTIIAMLTQMLLTK